jgi:hypothetical protein
MRLATSSRSPGARERGAAALEFMLMAMFWLPLLLGLMVLGLDLIREMQVTQVCRDAGRMYSNGIDFTQSSNQSLLLGLAQGLNMTATGGNGVVIFSTLTYIGPNQCTAAGFSANQTSCPNLNQVVVTNRMWVGNTSLSASAFGGPASSSSLIGASGSIRAGQASPYQNGYLTDPSCRATGFYSLLPLVAGQSAYMSEMFVSSPDYNFWSYLGTPATSARSIF